MFTTASRKELRRVFVLLRFSRAAVGRRFLLLCICLFMPLAGVRVRGRVPPFLGSAEAGTVDLILRG